MFMSVYGLSLLGLMEADPLLIQAEKRLIGQAEELIVLADSSKFAKKAGLILCGLDRVSTVITDTDASDIGGAAARAVRREGGHRRAGSRADPGRRQCLNRRTTPRLTLSTRRLRIETKKILRGGAGHRRRLRPPPAAARRS